MELHAAQEFLGGARSQHIVEAFSEVGVQIVQNQVNSTRFGIGASEKPVDEGCEVNFSPMGGGRDDSLSTLWFDRHEQVGVPLRSYSQFCLVGRRDVMGSGARLWPMSCRLFSSMQITGSDRLTGRANNSSSAYLRQRYSSVNMPMHQITRRQGLRSFF